MAKENVLKTKSFVFAVKIIRLYKYVKEKHSEGVLSKQLLRSGTSIGAMIREAEYAETTRDFVHKLSLSLKEINESIYWLQLLKAANYIDQEIFEPLYNDALEILKLLTASIKTIKNKLN
jgi:four helix bundle protein